MQMFVNGVAASAAGLLVCAAGAFGQVEYVLDDGVAETESSLSAFDAQVIWGNVFEAQPGAETITDVSVVFGSAVTAGRAVRVGVWNDPNNDGNILDAELLSVTDHIVQTGFVDAETFESFDVGGVDVSGTFFVGVIIDGLQGEAIFRQDFNLLSGTPNTGFESWTFFDPIGSGNTDLGAALGPNNNGDNGLGTWAVRATGVPAPGAVALVCAAGVAGVRRRR